MSDQDEVTFIAGALRDEGWAEHTALGRELARWVRLSAEVDTYSMTVDDYTNDLSSRDYLAVFMARASDKLRRAIEEQVLPADTSFLRATIDDVEELVGRYYRLDPQLGWWWRRRPSAGPLAEHLAHGD